jgi:thiosulfate/3-mercaptopyruvate sulfurtransferase
MKLVKILLSTLSFLILSMSVLTAQTDFITAKEFKDLMKSGEDYILVDASKSSIYAQNHIKGAINLPYAALNDSESDVSGVLLAPDKMAEVLGSYGISNDSKIIIYDDGSNKYSDRIYWALKYVGADNVMLLHKDMNEWGKVRLPLSTDEVTLEPTTFTPTVNKNVLATLDYVVENKDKPEVVLVDVRTPEEYKGEAKSDGHIPGAINLDYTELLNENGSFKTADELKAIAEKYNITPDKEVIFYCKTSVRGTVSWVAFRNVLGYENVSVFDGAYNEWVSNYPVVQ